MEMSQDGVGDAHTGGKDSTKDSRRSAQGRSEPIHPHILTRFMTETEPGVHANGKFGAHIPAKQ